MLLVNCSTSVCQGWLITILIRRESALVQKITCQLLSCVIPSSNRYTKQGHNHSVPVVILVIVACCKSCGTLFCGYSTLGIRILNGSFFLLMLDDTLPNPCL